VGGALMDIHKPKPIHNWREFLKEVGTIVLGVCIALGAEQAVEWWHWQGEVQAARRSLRSEMTSIAEFYNSRVALSSCLSQRLDAAAALIADAAAGRRVDVADMPFNGSGRLLSDSEWQSERASQVLTHFPRQELALMGRFYAQVTDMRGWVRDETTAWTHLALLQDAAQKLGSGDLTELRVNFHLARRYYNAITGNASQQLVVAAQLGLAPEKLSPDRIAKICHPVARKY
jgi:hypothetical protein